MSGEHQIPYMRSFFQIIEDEKKNRNIMEIHITKQTYMENNQMTKHRNLTFDELSVFIFDILHIRHEDILAIDYTTGRYDKREVKLKPGVEATPYLGKKEYMKHNINVTKQSHSITKVLFRNVPLNVPDEEILNLAICYGNIQGTVKHEKLFNHKDRNHSGSNRSIEIVLNKGASFENFYWMEGPLPGDLGRRITVTHPGQPMQCSNCFNYDHIKYTAAMGPVCPANGNGKACSAMETPRARMNNYMVALEKYSGVGYSSLKQKHMASIGSKMNMEEKLLEEGEEAEQEDRTTTLLPPMVERDKRITELEKENECINDLKEEIVKLKATAKNESNRKNSIKKKLDKAKKLVERQVTDDILYNAQSLRIPEERNPKIVILAEHQDIDEFDFDEANEITAKEKGEFLKEISKSLEEHAKKDNTVDKDLVLKELEEVKKKVLRVMKETGKITTMRNRRLSISSKRSSEDILTTRMTKQKLLPSPLASEQSQS